jgi:uncharacterized membrane protein
MANVGDMISKAAVFGVAGWLAENAICQESRYSPVFRGAQIPFLPIYAVNGVVLSALEPYVSKWPTLARGLAYALAGTAVEYAGCQVNRHMLSQRYGTMATDALTQLSSGCVDFKRSALWGGMGLIAERVSS